MILMRKFLRELKGLWCIVDVPFYVKRGRGGGNNKMKNKSRESTSFTHHIIPCFYFIFFLSERITNRFIFFRVKNGEKFLTKCIIFHLTWFIKTRIKFSTVSIFYSVYDEVR